MGHSAMRMLFTGGGTGGHTLPLIAVARELRGLVPGKDLQLFYLGPRDEFGTLPLAQEGVEVRRVAAGKLRRYLGFAAFFRNIWDVLVLFPLGILQAGKHMFFIAPDLVLSKGGYGALPVTLAARLLRIPVFLHESDIVPGLANAIAGRFAVEIFTSFPHTLHARRERMLYVGNPIRRDLLLGSKEEAVRLFGLQGNRPVLLVMGGSQGSQRINDLMLAILDEALGEFEIIHHTGSANADQVRREANAVVSKERRPFYHPVGFMRETDLRHAYAAADFVVSRAGAGVLFEIAALGKPSVLIPLPEAAQNHQYKNAYAYAETGAAAVLEEENLTPRFFLEKLRIWFSRKEELENMREAARAFAKPDAARILASYLVEYLEGP